MTSQDERWTVEHMQIDTFTPVIEMAVLANEETSGSKQYSSPMHDD